jgi:sporulation protein YlmC with PRC-barrel domain
MNPSTPYGSTAIDVISSDQVEGTAVYDEAGEKLGSIDDLMIDKRSGQVRYAVLEFGGFLGIGSDRYPVPWNMLKYDTRLDGYVVPLDKARLENAPRYPTQELPQYTTDYGRQVNGYYGIDR